MSFIIQFYYVKSECALFSFCQIGIDIVGGESMLILGYSIKHETIKFLMVMSCVFIVFYIVEKIQVFKPINMDIWHTLCFLHDICNCKFVNVICVIIYHFCV